MTSARAVFTSTAFSGMELSSALPIDLLVFSVAGMCSESTSALE